MAFTIPLDSMSPGEKLEAIELIWADLCRRPGEIPVPAWQIAILREREAAAARGEDPLIDLEDALRMVEDDLRCG